MMKKLLYFIPVVYFMASCGSKEASEKKEVPQTATNEIVLTDIQYKNAGIDTGRLGSRTISSVLKLNGKIDVPPQNMISISVPLGGYLRSTKLLPGMHVVKGEVLAVVEDQQYIQLQQDYLTAKAQLVYDEADYNRQQDLNESKASSDKVFEQARAQYQRQSVLVGALQQKLRLIGLNPSQVTAASITRAINIHSPIDGFVSGVKANIGKYVNPSDVLFELVNPEDIHLSLTVFEKDINKLSIGQKLMAYTNSNPSKKYLCAVILISKSLSTEGATEVHCHFEQYDKTLIPGMYMNADVEVSAATANSLPDDAVVRFENRQYVFVMKGKNRFEMRAIEPGEAENGYTQIVGGEKWLNETFVTKGAYQLLMAMKNKGED